MSTPPSHTQFTIRGASKEDESQILTLLPYLADFDIPIRRSSADLWSGDADLAKTILSGKAPSSFIDVAERDGGTVVEGQAAHVCLMDAALTAILTVLFTMVQEVQVVREEV